MSEEDKNLPYLYWTTKLHKVPFKHCLIAGSSKCTTKDLSCLLTKVLTTVTVGQLGMITLKLAAMESTACGLLKTPQACCHPWTNWTSYSNISSDI